MTTIDRSCQTCKMNLGGVCADHSGINGYGWKIDDQKANRTCWDASIEYLYKLAHSLPEDHRLFFEYRVVPKEDLYFRVEHGVWPKKINR
ncbi:hypothetical protein [Paenibacillus sp. HJGM_3]|uniref:hypothetical protein n=1 Tax=Paenibacillus sp. HJGM_3 TaxID=3379816 RepID=UPI00385B41D0